MADRRELLACKASRGSLIVSKITPPSFCYSFFFLSKQRIIIQNYYNLSRKNFQT
ncbi:hypothetical protein CWI38_0260p0010 [Hamiltosporidium tvaerminnensis]|uniref:Uncharacterized protein n=1 Tax=Hamiltosporidium tvaerminnensis TaxID=1176355 RepID=A0A4Q9LYY3_9MICR|nr:hypothetical protein CWI38_0260p0010 [Hamiltosporidium tvaerminnensis]